MLTGSKEQALKAAGKEKSSTPKDVLMGTLFFTMILALFIGGLQWLDSLTHKGRTEGFFSNTVMITPVRSDASWPWSSVSTRGVEIKLLRTGEYTFYPSDAYEVVLSVPGAISPAQHFILKSGEEDKTYPLNVEWQWMPGSIAQKENYVPQNFNISIIRRSDGARTAVERCFCGRSGIF